MTSRNTLSATDRLAYSDTVRKFNALQGRLRISVTHACQLNCRFCHQEGIDRHWEAIHISEQFFVGLVNSYTRLGGQYIELTGGEPTLHPRIGQLIDAVAGPDHHLILCTNGLRLDRVQGQIERRKLSLIKLSLHATDSSPAARVMLGNVWDFVRIERNVEAALHAGAQFQLIYTHTRHNSKYLESVLSLALLWDVHLQIVDLITSRAHRPGVELGYVGGDESEAIVRHYATLVRVARDRTGAVLKVYKTPNGRSWEIKDHHYGLLHRQMCRGCTKRTDCGEGIYALRVDSTGIVKPCLLREDLYRQIATHETEPLHEVLAETLLQMLSGAMKWS